MLLERAVHVRDSRTGVVVYFDTFKYTFTTSGYNVHQGHVHICIRRVGEEAGSVLKGKIAMYPNVRTNHREAIPHSWEVHCKRHNFSLVVMIIY